MTSDDPSITLGFVSGIRMDNTVRDGGGEPIRGLDCDPLTNQRSGSGKDAE